MNTAKQSDQKLQPKFEFIGQILATIVWLLFIVWLVRVADFEPGVPVKDVLGPHYVWIVMLTAAVFAVAYGFTVLAIGKATQRLFGKAQE